MTSKDMSNQHDTAPQASADNAQMRRLEQMSEREIYNALLQEDFQREAAVLRSTGMDRRTFLKVMGASLAVAGFGLSSCSTMNDPPEGEIIPYVQMPEGLIPGQPLFYATSMVLGGFANGLLIEAHQNRPTRIDGNPNHPASLGASDVLMQASMLELYNPERSIEVRNEGAISTWEEFLAALEDEIEETTTFRILTETVTSPALTAQINSLLENFPNASWVQYEPVNRDSAVAGSQLAFDEVVDTVYRFDRANVVLSLDGDFMTGYPGSIRYARDFMSGRKVRGEDATMNRLYAVESTPTITGATADNRLPLRASEVEAFTWALAEELGVEVGNAPTGSWNPNWLEAVAEDLRDNEGACVVVPGPTQSPVVHALAHAINAALGNVGETVVYLPSAVETPAVQVEALTTLVEEMNDGSVDALFILGGNPAFNAPADLGFADAMAQVDFVAHLSMYYDETSMLSTWHIPQAHFVEAWGDARAYDGTISIVQPPIGALYDTVRSAHDIISVIAGDTPSAFSVVRGYWFQNSGVPFAEFDMFWRRALHDGVIADSAPEPVTPSLRGDFADVIEEAEGDTVSGLELIFRPAPGIWDGRFANNSWLMEAPDPISKVSWDMVALMSPATAEELGVSRGDLLELTFNGQTMLAPAWPMPGHANNAVTVTLGYGRGLSPELDDGYVFNAYLLRTSGAMWFGGGLTVDNTGDSYRLAAIRSELEVREDDVESIYGATLTEFNNNPTSVIGDSKVISLLDANFEYTGYAWGMSIDLTSCIGCNACLVACQMENNIPAVGKDEVARQREMHWIRVDRYYVEGSDGQVQTQFQPVPCMQCENAPCEQVCPVHATVHDAEGLNNMVYNRCIGTRYCSANCPYTVRRFNFFDYVAEDPIHVEWRNPDVSVRPEGVMEKCTYCVQRINAARIEANNEDRQIRDGEIVVACAGACPTQAISFGNINDPDAQVTQLKALPHDYGLLAKLNTQPRTTYLARLTNPNPALQGSEGEA